MPDIDEGDLFVAPMVIASRGGGVFLIDLGNGKGHIAETKSGMLFPARNRDAIIARGCWEEVDDVDVADVPAAVTPGPSR